jgi:hypothetical protein
MRGGVPVSGMFDDPRVTIRVTTTTGQVVCDSISCPLALHYTSANPAIAYFNYPLQLRGFTTSTLRTLNPGRTLLTASTWYYGTTWSDTLTFTVNYRSHADIFMQIANNRVTYNSPPTLVIGVGADVSFYYVDTTGCNPSVDIVFDDPSAADTASSDFYGYFITGPPTGSGNIDAFCGVGAFDGIRTRRFLKSGQYHYHSTVLPSDTNTILVLQGVQ